MEVTRISEQSIRKEEATQRQSSSKLPRDSCEPVVDYCTHMQGDYLKPWAQNYQEADTEQFPADQLFLSTSVTLKQFEIWFTVLG